MQTEVNSNVSYSFKFLKLLKKSDSCRKIKQKIHPFFAIKWKSGTTEAPQDSQTTNNQLFKRPSRIRRKWTTYEQKQNRTKTQFYFLSTHKKDESALFAKFRFTNRPLISIVKFLAQH